MSAEKDQESIISRDNKGIKVVYQKYMNQEGVRRQWAEPEPERARWPGGRPRDLGGRPGGSTKPPLLKSVPLTDLKDQ